MDVKLDQLALGSGGVGVVGTGFHSSTSELNLGICSHRKLTHPINSAYVEQRNGRV